MPTKANDAATRAGMWIDYDVEILVKTNQSAALWLINIEEVS